MRLASDCSAPLPPRPIHSVGAVSDARGARVLSPACWAAATGTEAALLTSIRCGRDIAVVGPRVFCYRALSNVVRST